jgi:hypothetical protein
MTNNQDFNYFIKNHGVCKIMYYLYDRDTYCQGCYFKNRNNCKCSAEYRYKYVKNLYKKLLVIINEDKK